MTSFDELSRKRRDFVKIARENDAEEGLRRLLADLYPDNAHFIYELLQNAEDAGASQIRFRLDEDRLVVEHDGTKSFDLGNVTAITNIGGSTKASDVTTIGQFGVGFKAVFAYTMSPEVHSGEFSFVIRDLFVPERLPSAAQPGWTTFIFPFDRRDKPPAQASVEIQRGLLELGENTLMFLQSIRLLSYQFSDGTSGSVERREVSDERLIIHHEGPAGASETHWLRLLSDSTINEDGHERKVPIAAAFQLVRTTRSGPDDGDAKGADQKKAKQGPSADFSIEPLDVGQVSIFFPAAKETSGLRFHIHARFASTVARDSVRDAPENDQLIAALANLVADSLPRLRDQGMITNGLLAALPNANDALPERYSVIRRAVIAAFRTQELTPVHGSLTEFAAAQDLLASPSQFRRVMSLDDLNYLADLWDPSERRWRWVAERSGRARSFLDGLGVTTFGWDELTESLANVADGRLDDDISQGWERWLMSKTMQDLRAFYGLLGERELDLSTGANKWRHQLHGSGLRLPELPLVRLTDRSKLSHVLGSSAFLPATANDTGSNRVPLELVSLASDPDKDAAWLSAFYLAAGVKVWDRIAKIVTRLKAYEGATKPDPDGSQYIKDMKEFVRFALAEPSQIKIFQKVNFLRGLGPDGNYYWASPDNIFIDEPYAGTGLSAIFADKGKGRYRLWHRYYEKLEGMLGFVESLGCMSEFRLSQSSPYANKKFSFVWVSEGQESHKGPGATSTWSTSTPPSNLATSFSFEISGVSQPANPRHAPLHIFK